MAAAKGFNPVQFTFDSIPYVVGGVGVYEGYLFLSNTPPMFTPDPIYDFIKKNIIPLLPKVNPTGTCPTGQTWNATTQQCVTDVVPCPTGQVRDGAGNCVPIGTGCTTPTTAVPPAPITTVTFAAPLDNASVVAGTTVSCGGTIPAGLSLAKIGVRVLAGTDASFVNQDWVEMITWIDKLAPVPGPWNVSVPIPASMAAGRYLFACHVTGTDCTAYFPYKWINITASGTQPPTCALGEQLVNGVCIPITCNTGFHLLNGVCVANDPTDAVPPLVAITSPLTGANSNASVVHLTGTASDVGSGLAGVFVRITNIGLGTPWLPATLGTGGAWSIDFDTFTSGDFVGPYIFQARADDVAGNMQWSNMVTVNYTPGSGTGTCPTGQKIGGTSGACESIVTTYNSGGATIKDTFAPGETLRVTATGFAVNESVEFRLRINQSSVQVLNGTANGSGSVTMAMTIPVGQAPTTDAYVMCTGTSGLIGRHTIAITATGLYARAYAYPARLFGSSRFADLVQQPIRARRFR